MVINPYAVFVVARTTDGIAATTREDGRIGLPGGVVEHGEIPIDAAKREAYEEGWSLGGIDPEPIHKDYVDGRMVWWYMGRNPMPLESWMEQHRGITPISVSVSDIAASGFGNEFISDIA